MGERNADWGSAWLFVLWAMMVIASVAGWHASDRQERASQAYKEPTRSLSAFTLAAPTAAPTTREKRR